MGASPPNSHIACLCADGPLRTVLDLLSPYDQHTTSARVCRQWHHVSCRIGEGTFSLRAGDLAPGGGATAAQKTTYVSADKVRRNNK